MKITVYIGDAIWPVFDDTAPIIASVMADIAHILGSRMERYC